MSPSFPRRCTLYLTLLLLLFSFGCTDQTIRLGVVVPSTGVDQPYGEVIRRGIELAYEEIQAQPDNHIELIIVDSESKPETAAAKLEEVFDQGALAAVGGITSDEVGAMLEVVDRYDRVLLSPSASAPELSGISRNFYRIIPSDYTAATKMADFAVRAIEAKTMVLVTEERAFARGIESVFKPAYEELGGQVIETISIPVGLGEMSGLMERVVTLNPDAVYLAAYEARVGAMIQSLRQLNYQGRILTTSAFAKTSAIARAGQDAEGVLLTQSVFEPDSEHAHVQKFVNAYEERYGEKPDIFAAYGYDAMKVLATAISGRPNLASEVHKGMREIKDMPGVTGSISFNEKGDIVKYPRVYIIGEDLALYDYNARVREQQDKIRQRREELQRQLEEIRRQAKEIG